MSWGYTKEDGPATWLKKYPAAKGNRQTPIDIDPSIAKYDESLQSKPLKINYKADITKSVTNNGHSFQTNIVGVDSTLEGGPLEYKYQLVQFHFHWGRSDGHGSEHTVNGQPYSAELHLVHWNTELFSSAAEAASHDKGLAVLGIFIKVGEEHHGFEKINGLLEKIQYKGETAEIADGFDPAILLPEDTDRYWTYEGSLTTPPCYESVSWIVFKDPIEFSHAQLEHFRSLHEYERDSCRTDEFGGHIMDNFRPPFKLCGRTLISSFTDQPLKGSKDSENAPGVLLQS